ncbi:MAG: uroporphyrinogen-III C-methyltransferase [Methylococcales bacterium]|jgi:uroporphyrin-III C-methyltransferase/precorrin-2 dehydrogenase/sirohydrochlorin ferrochelatase|nr:uroporphyrinogen-III C-methyltransferase [Methylococcales bacterium]MBT4663573.1 uroporphyrinogen-III C-methyltransferase [Methylococcales bacterium]
MHFFPIFLRLNQQKCLIVGAGEIAARKIEILAKSGARITVLAPSFSTPVQTLEKKLALTLIQKKFESTDAEGYRLIVSATDNQTVNELVSQAADKLNILVNVVDNPKLCQFIFPAIIDRSPIIAAISSGGTAPVLARLLKTRVETLIPSGYGRLAELAGNYRDKVKSHILDPRQRRLFWEQVFQGSIAEFIFAGQHEKAEHALNKQLIAHNTTTTDGEIYLVGAGPGDPDLLTLRALRLIQQADIVVYDRLVSEDILNLIRRDAQKIYVGKKRDQHTLPQESINQLLTRLALEGNRVVRLKGGDPFIFGRGGEEIETLMENNINFQVVPGITAASGCASYAGIPLTHREYAQSCTFVTGHYKDNQINLNWEGLVAPNQTLVIYMGLLGLNHICASLIEHGCSKDLPAALIQQGTTKHQKVITGTLESLPHHIHEQSVKAPTLIIVGNVVRLHDKLTWFNPNA